VHNSGRKKHLPFLVERDQAGSGLDDKGGEEDGAEFLTGGLERMRKAAKSILARCRTLVYEAKPSEPVEDEKQ